MRRNHVVSAVVGSLVVVLGCVSGQAQGAKSPAYAIRGEQMEGCECDSVCPCVWTKDVTFQDCRGILAWHVTEGTYGGTDLRGVTFAVVLKKSGKNVVKAMGTWEGIIYVDEAATESQRKAAVGFASGKWGKAFAKVEVRSAPMAFKLEGEHRDLTIGKVARLSTVGIAGSDGKVPVIENPPFAIIPRMSCATAAVHSYDDGDVKWDFAGRNGFYGRFDYRSE